ncbi:hypothetical protein ACL9RF_14560 [Sphingobacterium sp. Mn56C]|uniref:hypothetical protein n=1 Tax=Sphingobacterium sp. Mn56C TaxID=3395261 RepID=UPI003BD00414
MKKLILTGLSFLFAITLTFAQGQQVNPETKAQEIVTELTQKLTLKEEQQKVIYAIELEKITAVQAIKANADLDDTTKKEQIRGVKVTANSKISENLTDEQKALFIKYLEEKEAAKVK